MASFKCSKSDFSQAVELWQEWNEKINVISRKDTDSIFEHHILHSLAIAAYLEKTGRSVAGETFLDVGTGGGFPGIPLALALPEASFTLCDSIGKKVKVASAVADGLGLKNVRCVNCRVENLEGNFDWIVSRAVTSLDKFYPWVKGRYSRSILYLKGGDVETEILEMCARCGVERSSVELWPVSDWLSDGYFAEKFVLEIKF